MNTDSACNIMEKKQFLQNQAKEPYEEEKRDYARTCSNCSSNLISPRVFPPLSYPPCMNIYGGNDWEVSQELRLQELEEAKARTAQMEKTMRWWSDCTANWREKWSKVRVERNKARDEGRQLKLKLEESIKQLSALKKINEALLAEKEEMGAQNIWKNSFSSSEMCWRKNDCLEPLEKDSVKLAQNKKIFELESICQEVYASGHPLRDHQDMRINLEILDSGDKYIPVFQENSNRSKDDPIHCQNDETVHVSVLHLQLHESQKTLQKEQKIRSSLEKEIEKVKSERSLWKWKYEELQKNKQEKQFDIRINLHQTEVEKNMEDFEKATEAKSPQDLKSWQLQGEITRD
ncbi:coiled-coil domain-containing protein 102B-like isoform X2 [Sceloporus undulatus]|uniref:coiled-coil domain-containing protein 102B-like isoform X2 n=1 Tax=Sceloporus undulatus TaxID=8520 RepID=UPI001C4A7838|nr:coiled-coil domain-containing protein 102B-like isoform X2 [Sceloporus undulatus]